MTASPSRRGVLRPALWVDAASYSDGDVLRAVVVAAGLCWSAAFVAIGLGYDLQMYGDGAIFSYSVAVEDAWAIHWHNISGRLFVYLLCFVPAEIVVDITRNPHGGIVVYGLLHFAATARRSMSFLFMPVCRPPASAHWCSAFRPNCG